MQLPWRESCGVVQLPELPLVSGAGGSGGIICVFDRSVGAGAETQQVIEDGPGQRPIMKDPSQFVDFLQRPPAAVQLLLTIPEGAGQH